MTASATVALKTVAEKFLADGYSKSSAQWLVDYLEGRYGFPLGAVLELEADSGLLRPLALSRQGGDNSFVERDAAYVASREPRIHVGITGWVAATGVSALSGNVQRDQRYQPLRTAIRTELCVPILIPRRIFGVFNTESTQSNLYRNADLVLLQKIGRLVGLVLGSNCQANSDRVSICAWCRRVKLETGWVAVELALIDSLDPSLSHGICPTCLHGEAHDLIG